ncbi:hypothetical protein [Streptomyces sp. NPDC050804]|uniref:hypothetical protein n=1 Tax=Streptomyces sp. NPDC050804 TaxID=3154745 RepID=UPI0034252C1B
MWRRNFLKAAGALGAGAAAAGVGSGGEAGGRELLSAHRELRQAHGRLDNLCGASAVYAQAVPHHQAPLTWHASVRSPGERRHIAALVADTGGFVAFLTNDLGMPGEAVDHYREAAEYAMAAGDVSCCANLVGQMARIRADQGDFPGALRLSERAVDMAGTLAHPSVRSWLRAVRAHHHAGVGEARKAKEDLKAAWALLERCDDGEMPGYMGYLSTAELGKWSGHVMAQLGRSDAGCIKSGLSTLDEALGQWPTGIVRGSAEVLTVAARLRAASGDLDEARGLVSRAITVATSTGSARNLNAALAAHGALLGGREALPN